MFSPLAALQRLFGRVPDTGHMACIHRNTGIVAYPSCDVFRLIIAPLSESLRMQRHRHNYLDFIEEIRVLHLHRSLLSQVVSDERLIRIFHLMHQLLNRMIFLVEEKRSSAFQMHGFGGSDHVVCRPHQSHLCAVLIDRCLLRPRQIAHTFFAETNSFFPDVPPAHRADTGIEEATKE